MIGSTIYKKTFHKETLAEIEVLDNNLSSIEESINELSILYQNSTKGNKQTLYDREEGFNSYENILENMGKCLSDLYSYKNSLIEQLEEDS